MQRSSRNKYKLNQNIVDVTMRSHYRYGRCKMCNRTVKAKNWHKHLHENWQQQIQQQRNQACLTELINKCNLAVWNKGQSFLNDRFSEGITDELKEIYIKQVLHHLQQALTADPRRTPQALANINPKKKQPKIITELSEQEKNMPYNSSVKEGDSIAVEQEYEINKEIVERGDTKLKVPKSRLQIEADTELYDYMFVKTQYEVSLQGVKLKTLLNSYMSNRQKAETLAKQFNPRYIQDHSLLYALKQCFICQLQIDEVSGTFRECIFCRTRIHVGCFALIDHCLCSNFKMVEKANHVTFRQLYGEPEGLQRQNILSNHYQGITPFTPKTPKKKIEQAEKVIKDHVLMRVVQYSNVALAPKGLHSQTDALRDPFLVRAPRILIDIYDQYKREEYKAPVEIMQLDKTNFGIKAMEDIPVHALICEYACDILPMTCAYNIVYKNQIMFYANGKNSQEELILAPYNCMNWGPLINHHDQGNCASLRIVINQKIRVLLYSKAKIKKGEQLLYNYNSELKEYPTQGFVNMQK